MSQGATAGDQAVVPFGRRIRELAEQRPADGAIVVVHEDHRERTLTYAELERFANQAAHALAEAGVDQSSMVVLGLGNVAEHFVWTVGAWKLGACVLALNPRLPAHERDQILQLAAGQAIVSIWPDVGGLDPDAYADRPDDALPDMLARPARAVASGGSTGRSKVIVLPDGLDGVPGEPDAFEVELAGFEADMVQLVAGPLYHNMPNGWSYLGLFHGHRLVVMERFDAARAVELVERHRVSFAAIVPTHMARIAKLPDIDTRDLSSLRAVLHSAAPCPPWLKRRWIELVGPERLYEGFGATEAVGFTAIRGDEWLAHPGSVGRPKFCTLRILDEQGRVLPPGEVGEIFMRRETDEPSYAYLGSPPAKSTPDGFVSVGDLGWVDEQGYLYVADRRVDLIISGGSNVYPAEVEAVLVEHEAVGDVAVIGLSDPEWGRRVHAVVERRREVSEDELRAFCKQRLSAYKVPKTFEFVVALPRNDAGKIRRGDLVAEREAAG